MKKNLIIFVTLVVVATIAFLVYEKDSKVVPVKVVEEVPEIPADRIPEDYKLKVLQQLTEQSSSSSNNGPSIEERRKILQSLGN